MIIALDSYMHSILKEVLNCEHSAVNNPVSGTAKDENKIVSIFSII